MSLSVKEYIRLEKIQESATPDEMESFLNLIVKSGSELEMLNYMETLNLYSIDEVRVELKKHQRDSGIATGLAIAGGAILLAALLSK